jgi:4-carboxymuconolactone decarboxylase
MTRIAEITARAQVSPDAAHIFDAIIASRGGILGPYPMLLHSPELAGRTAHLGSYVRFESTLSAVDRELAVITACREFDCDFAWSAHATMAREAGVREHAIEVVANRASLDSLTRDEAAIVAYGRELLRDKRVSEATFDAARARLGDQGVLELTATIGYYGMLACVLNAFEVTPPPDTPRLP